MTKVSLTQTLLNSINMVPKGYSYWMSLERFREAIDSVEKAKDVSLRREERIKDITNILDLFGGVKKRG